MLKYKDSLDRAFHALTDETRRAIVYRLAEGEASVSELAAPFPMSLSAVHQHLALLQEAGLVTSEKKGRVRTCRLNGDVLSQTEDWLRDRRQMWERKLDALDEYLSQEEGGEKT